MSLSTSQPNLTCACRSRGSTRTASNPAYRCARAARSQRQAEARRGGGAAQQPLVQSAGTRIEVDHLKAVPDGTTVRAHARLSGYKGRFLIFDVEAKAGDIVIGRGKVFRAIVESGKHGEKARARVT